MEYGEFLEKKKFNDVHSGFILPHNQIAIHGAEKKLKDFQIALVRWALGKGRAAIFADTGLGKQHPITEPVLTPNGWMQIGQLEIGDFVIGSNGKPTKVIGIFPQGNREIVKVNFNDGTFSRVGWEHLWSVRTKTDKYRGNDYRVMNTKEIADSIHRDWQIPVVSPVEFNSDDNLPIEPYFYGVLLGDGSCGSVCPVITTDEWIIDHLNIPGVKNPHPSEGIVEFRCHKVSDAIRDANLLGKRSWEKSIDVRYFTSSIEDRISILQGLLDTDGHPMTDGGIEYCSTSEQLMIGVVHIVRSLGGIARNITSRKTNHQNGEGRISWRVNIKMPEGIDPFRLPRKLNKYVKPTKYPVNKIIKSIESENVYEEAVCIAVDAPDHLYVTRDFIVTHNTAMQTTWAHHVAGYTDMPVLILAPLAVAQQTVKEAESFGVTVRYVRHQEQATDGGIWITNYEMIDHFDLSLFSGVVLDESSILKSQDGSTRTKLIEMCQRVPYRLSCTATPSPNDFMELGNQAQFLGIMSQTEMLAMFFTLDSGPGGSGKGTNTWRLKGHGRKKFWEWMSTWAAVVRKPSDLGFDDEGYNLPPLNIIEHVITQDAPQDGQLFVMPAQSLTERRKAKRGSLEQRCAIAAELVNASDESWIVWCHLNDEQDMLNSLIKRDCASVQGSDSIKDKEDRLLGFAHGDREILLSKPSIAGYGLNLQHSHNMVFVGLDDSFEKFYQAVRRQYRFGQTRQVNVHIVVSESEGAIKANLERKQKQHEEMSDQMVSHMRELMQQHITGTKLEKTEYNPKEEMEIPKWLKF